MFAVHTSEEEHDTLPEAVNGGMQIPCTRLDEVEA